MFPFVHIFLFSSSSNNNNNNNNNNNYNNNPWNCSPVAESVVSKLRGVDETQ